MKVLSAAAEIYPLVKTGGLADVVGALPTALAGQGVAMRCLVPGYRPVMSALDGITVLHRYADLFGGPASLVAGKAGGLDLIAIDAPHLYDRPGNPYLGPDGSVRSRATDRYETLPVELVFRSVGYRGVALPDVPYDASAGVIPNIAGRVVDAEGRRVGDEGPPALPVGKVQAQPVGPRARVARA